MLLLQLEQESLSIASLFNQEKDLYIQSLQKTNLAGYPMAQVPLYNRQNKRRQGLNVCTLNIFKVLSTFGADVQSFPKNGWTASVSKEVNFVIPIFCFFFVVVG